MKNTIIPLPDTYKVQTNHFVYQTAEDYFMSYEQVKAHYDKYGSTPMFYEELERDLKARENS